MEKEFIKYEQALALKELGFDEPCLGHYQDRDETTVRGAVLTSNNVKFFIGETDKGFIVLNSSVSNCVLTPLYQQAFRWFREKYGVFSSIWRFETEHKFFIEFGFGIQKFEVSDKENTELECLKKLIEIVKRKIV